MSAATGRAPRPFLILTVVGAPFVPVFSSGQFVSIRGTEKPSCIQPLKPPFNSRRATVWPRASARLRVYTTCTRMDLSVQSFPSRHPRRWQPLSGSERNHESTCRIVGLKIKGFKGERGSYGKKGTSRVNDIEKTPREGALSFGFIWASGCRSRTVDFLRPSASLLKVLL